MLKINSIKLNNKGFSLVETLVATAIFVTVSVGIYSGFVGILKAMNIIRVKGIMTNLANEQFEIVRNLSYQSVGVINGIPSGTIPQSQTTDRDGKNFNIETIVRNIDDDFDGTFDGMPKDLSPADMKMVELTISCNSCDGNLSPISFTTKIAPKNLETASVNGALVVRVFDGSGSPVPGASVNIINNSLTPKINLTDVTDINGILTIVDAPPAIDSYKIIVTKDGYSTEQTYLPGEVSNPNPVKPNVTVVVQQITQISFTIDKTSVINISSINNQCQAVPSFDFNFFGSKIIGTSPDIFKYKDTFSTGSSGLISLSDIEWDNYNIVGLDGLNDIIGTNPLFPLSVSPGVNQDIDIITAPKNGRRLLVVVKDQSSGLPITDAVVTLTGPNGYLNTITTNEGYISQTDWSSGSGQDIFVVDGGYFYSDGNIDYSNVGVLSLNKISENFVSSGYLESSSFDTGSLSNFKKVIWQPETAPVQTGENSIRVQIATNNDNTTWDFLGPDGTSSSYYTSANQNINSIHSGHRYLRYRIYLSTLDTAYSPIISDMSITFTSSCIPPGQVSFPALTQGSYSVSVSKDGYQDISSNIEISESWTMKDILMAQ